MAARSLAFRMAVSVACLAMVAAQALAQSEGRKPASLPEELTDTVKADFEMVDCFEEGQPSLEEQTETERLNITTTTGMVLLVSGAGTCLAAGNNRPFLIYARLGNNWRKILRADGNTLRLLQSMLNGWHDLEVLYRSSQSETARYVYRFSKAAYHEASCEILNYSGGSDRPQRKGCPGWAPK
jgi:hypothetical protein